MTLRYEPASEPLPISVTWLGWGTLQISDPGAAHLGLILSYFIIIYIYIYINVNMQVSKARMDGRWMDAYEETVAIMRAHFPGREAGPPNHHDDKVDSDQ